MVVLLGRLFKLLLPFSDVTKEKRETKKRRHEEIENVIAVFLVHRKKLGDKIW